MDPVLILENIEIQISLKKIKNIHLRVRATDGAVTVSAPRRMSMDAIKAFVQSKLAWIKKHRHKLQSQPHSLPKQYVDGELHYLFGQQYPLRVVQASGASKVVFNDAGIALFVRPSMSHHQRQAVLDHWYRAQLKSALPALIEQYEKRMNVKVSDIAIRAMKTRWGSCNIRTAKICFNLELAKRPVECLEYIVVHELAHLLEPSHNKRFVGFMDQYLPDWKQRKKQLNQLLLF